MNKPNTLSQVYPLFFLLLIAISSCNYIIGSSKTDYKLTNILVNVNKAQNTNFDSIYKFNKFIQLETNKFSIISDISKLVVTKDSVLIILDRKQQSVFFFSFSGKFLKAVRKLGGGPEEYRNIKDITYNPDDKSVVILDLGTQSLVSYSVPTGTFLKRTKIKERETYGYSLDYYSGNYIFNRLNFTAKSFPGQISIARASDLKLIGNGIPQIKVLVNKPVTIPHALDISDQYALHLDFLNDTIYKVKDNKVQPIYHFKYPDDKANKVAREIMNGQNNYGDDYIGRLFSDDGVWNFAGLFQSGDLINFTFNYKTQGYNNIYNSKSLKNYSVTPIPILKNKYYVNPPIAKFQDILISTAMEKDNNNKAIEQNPLLCTYRINESKFK